MKVTFLFLLLLASKINANYECPLDWFLTSHYQFPTRNGSRHVKCLKPNSVATDYLNSVSMCAGKMYSPYLTSEISDGQYEY